MPVSSLGDMPSIYSGYYNGTNKTTENSGSSSDGRELIAQTTPPADPFDPLKHQIGTFVDHTGQVVIYYYDKSTFANSPFGQGLGKMGSAVENFWNNHHWPHVVANDAMLASPGEEGMAFEGRPVGEGPFGAHSYGISENEFTAHWAQEAGVGFGEPTETFNGYEFDDMSVDSTEAVSSPINYIVENDAVRGEIVQALRDEGYSEHAIDWIMSGTSGVVAYFDEMGQLKVEGADAQNSYIRVITPDRAIQLGANRAEVTNAQRKGAIFIQDSAGEVIAFTDNKLRLQVYKNYVANSDKPLVATQWNEPGSAFQLINIHTNPYS